MRWKKPSNYMYCVTIHKDHNTYNPACPFCNQNTDYIEESVIDYLIKWNPNFIRHQEDIATIKELA